MFNFSINKENLYKDVKNEQMIYIPANFNHLKIEQVFTTDYSGEKQPKGTFRIFLNLDSGFSQNNNGVFKLRIKKWKQQGNVVFHYYLLQESFNELRREIEPVLQDMLLGNGSKHGDKIITFDEVMRENSKKVDNEKDKVRYTVLHIEYGQPQSEEDKESPIFKIENPDEELLTHLSDFSEMKEIIYSYPTKLKGKEAKNKVREIFKKHNVSEELQDQFITAFKIFHFIDGNQKKIQVKCGGVLYGPFGTGKTYIIQNPIREIFETVLGFGYEELNLVENVGTGDSQYWGAAMRLVNRVFMPIFKLIQNEQKPYFYFVDEGDKFAKNPVHSDDQEGATGIKNLLNPKGYPGLILCLNTNLESGELNQGLLGRRLSKVMVDYPDETICYEMWKIYRELVFGEDKSGNFTEEQYQELARIVAGKIGIDAIESFCSDYRSLTNTEENAEVDYQEFKQRFFKYVLGRVHDLRDSKIRELESGPFAQHMASEIEEVKQKSKEQEKEIISAFEGKGSDKIDPSLIEGLSKSGDDNEYYRHYKLLSQEIKGPKLLELIIKFNEEGNLHSDGDFNFFESFYRESNFILEHFQNAPSTAKEILSGNMINTIKELNEYVIFILLEIDAKRTREKFSHLIAKEGEMMNSGKITEVLSFLKRELPNINDLVGRKSNVIQQSSEGLIQRP